jgi:drug/metabolite transporter (DMT)-like permease
MNFSKLPLRLTVGLALAIALDTAVQISLKTAVVNVPIADSAGTTALALLQHPLVLAVIILKIGQLINWLTVLAHADLSYAQPITSLSSVSVCILSVVYLQERVDSFEVLGVSLMLAGVWFVCSTDHVSQPVMEPMADSVGSEAQ